MSNKLFEINNNGTINIRRFTTIQNGSEFYSVENKLLKGNYIYLYMNENSFYMTSKPINRIPNDTFWTKDLAVIPIDKESDIVSIEVGKYLLGLSSKDKDGNYSYGFNGSDGSFYLYFDSRKFKMCKPFRMEADGELLKYPSFLDNSIVPVYYDTYNIDDNNSINLPCIITHSNDNGENSKSGLKLDVQMFNDMFDNPLDEGEALYLTAITNKVNDSLYKHYLYPIFRTKINSRKKGVTRKK